MSLFRVFVAMLAIAAFGGCASPRPESPAPEAPPSAAVNAPYRLAERRPPAGHRLRPGQSQQFLFGRQFGRHLHAADRPGPRPGTDDGRARARDRGAPASGLCPRTQRVGGSRSLPAHLRPGRGRRGGAIRVRQRHDGRTGGRGRRRVHAARGRGQRGRHPRRRRPPRDVRGAARPIRSGRATRSMSRNVSFRPERRGRREPDDARRRT